MTCMGIDSAVARITLVFIVIGVASGQTSTADYVALLQEGRAAFAAGQFESATSALGRAAAQMEAAGQGPEATLPVLLALSTAWLNLENVSRAERALLDGDKLAAAATSTILKAALKNNWAIVYLKIGRYAQARGEVADGLNLIDKLPGAQLLEAKLLNTLVVIETRLGHYAQAVLHQQRALDLWMALRSPNDPDVIQAHTAMGVAEYFSGRAQAAHLSFESAITSARQTYGGKHPLLAQLLQNDAVVLTRLGLKSEAKAQLRAANRAAGASLPPASLLTQAVSALEQPVR